MSTREQILSAAEILFARRGYDGVTINQIAHEAGLTKGALYYFFRNKADLFCSIIDRGISFMEEECRAILTAPRSEQEIAQSYISFFTNIAYENANFFLILFGGHGSQPQIQQLFDRQIARLMNCIREGIDLGCRYSRLRPLDPDILTRLFVGAVYGMLALPDPPDPASAAQTLRLLLEEGLYAERKE